MYGPERGRRELAAWVGTLGEGFDRALQAVHPPGLREALGSAIESSGAPNGAAAARVAGSEKGWELPALVDEGWGAARGAAAVGS